MAEENKINVRLTDGLSSEEVEVDLKTESDENLKFLWEVIKSEEARQELKLRTGLDPAKNFSTSTKEDIEYFIQWSKDNPEKHEELYGHLKEKYGI
jgi:hypothetical protein